MGYNKKTKRLEGEPFTPVSREPGSYVTPGGGGMTTPLKEPIPGSVKNIVQQNPEASVMSEQPLEPGRINKFFVPAGEVTEEEYKTYVARSKIISEGGRRGIPTAEQAAAFAQTPGISQALEGTTAEVQKPEMTQGFPSLAKGFFQGEPIPSEYKTTAGGASVVAGMFFAALDIFSQFAGRATGGKFGSRKPLTLVQSQETFNKLASSLRSDISAINPKPDPLTGLTAEPQDPAATAIKLQQALAAINQYEAYNKDYGFLNMQHWIDSGAEAEADILIMKDTLRDMQNDLAIAKQQWLVRQYVNQPIPGSIR